ncbi:DUF4190 domain-containing protein [Weissella confusa]|uniref:DUF4190 domain-containing protein n=1 Tax=Weissella fermenti TaxID=2987699 RepID=A0ABT6D8L3_9LACO|nr:MULTISPECIES: DUF4190 domain-containing protein [Weissella]MBJ7689243.1 DUF4190 domain-containing protein [Weissella confusa]MDF9300870.1 DUF4190 domain-containing protein [Weissella sp. BK2]
MGKRDEDKLLGIIALILAILALTISWIPIVNNFGGILAVIGIVLGGLSLFVNRSRQKIFASISTILSVIALVIVLVTQSLYGASIDKFTKSIAKTTDSSFSLSSSKRSDKFKWTNDDYNSLTVGDKTTGVGGANYEDIISKYGNPTSVTETQSDDRTVRKAMWSHKTSDEEQSVELTFVMQQDGSYSLSKKDASIDKNWDF